MYFVYVVTGETSIASRLNFRFGFNRNRKNNRDGALERSEDWQHADDQFWIQPSCCSGLYFTDADRSVETASRGWLDAPFGSLRATDLSLEPKVWVEP